MKKYIILMAVISVASVVFAFIKDPVVVEKMVKIEDPDAKRLKQECMHRAKIIETLCDVNGYDFYANSTNWDAHISIALPTKAYSSKLVKK